MIVLAAMQPYFFPYLGYFQLIHAADRIIFLDDVNFINRGWIHRNRLMLNGRAHYFTVPLIQKSQNRLINDIRVDKGRSWQGKMIRTFSQAYRRARYVDEGLDILNSVLTAPAPSIATLALHSITAVMRYIGLERCTELSSARTRGPTLTGTDLITDLCLRKGANTYLNLPGGRSLYSAETFASHGLRLAFLAPVLPKYDQFSEQFLPGLSVLDAIMHCSPEEVLRMVQQYSILDADQGSSIIETSQ